MILAPTPKPPAAVVDANLIKTNDSLYLALAEQLSADRKVTFDSGMKNQATANAPTLDVVVLPVN